MRNIYLFVFSLLFICSITSRAKAEDDLQLWTAVTASGKFSQDSKFHWWVEAQPRIGDDIHYIERLLARGAVGYEINKNLIGWAGYGWTPLYMNSSYEHDFNNETRIFQQLTYDQKFEGWSLSHRLRVEERDIDNVQGTPVRLRYFIKASLPLYTLENSTTLGLSSYDEYFYNLNSASPSVGSGPDRNRIFAGPYWKNDYLRIDLGYLLETSERINHDDRHIHAIASYISFNL